MTNRIIPVRASSWGGLFDCAYKWEGEQLLGMRKPSGMRAHLGTAIHAGTAAFDLGRMPGNGPLTVDEAAGAFVDALHHPAYDVATGTDDLKMREAERIGLLLHTAYCYDVSPQFQFRSVEGSLQPLDIDCGGGITVRLTGTMDRARVAESDAGVVIPDIKTGQRVIENGVAQVKGRSAQLGTYQLMYESETGELTAGGQVIALKTSKKPEVAVSRVIDAKRVMLGNDTTKGLIAHAADMFRSGNFPPNPSSPLCSEKYCARWNSCTFHE